MQPLISVIVPVYRAEDCLHKLYERLIKTLETITKNFEILLIEDCGGDQCWDIILDLTKKDQRVKGIQFSRNFGQHYGITAGIDHCTGKWAVIMDCDLQDQPEEIPRLYYKALEGYDVVLANREKRKDPFAKRLLSSLYYKIFNYFLDFKYNGQAGNFRIISEKVVMNLQQMREQIRFFGGLVTWMGFPTTEITVEHAERFSGESTYSFKKLLKLASNSIIAYSDKPLRLTIRLGFIISALAFSYGIYIVLHAFLNHTTVAGWSSLIVSVYFIGGMIISILGIIGIYLGKTFDETKRRPLYIIGRKTFDN